MLIDSTAAVFAATVMTFAVVKSHASPAVDLRMLASNDAMSSSFFPLRPFRRRRDIPANLFSRSGFDVHARPP